MTMEDNVTFHEHDESSPSPLTSQLEITVSDAPSSSIPAVSIPAVSEKQDTAQANVLPAAASTAQAGYLPPSFVKIPISPTSNQGLLHFAFNRSSRKGFEEKKQDESEEEDDYSSSEESKVPTVEPDQTMEVDQALWLETARRTTEKSFRTRHHLRKQRTEGNIHHTHKRTPSKHKLKPPGEHEAVKPDEVVSPTKVSESDTAGPSDASLTVRSAKEFDFSCYDLQDVLDAVASNAEKGLASDEAGRRLAQNGPNNLQTTPPPTIFALIFAAFAQLLIILLTISGIIALALQEYVEGAAVLVTVLINIMMTVFMEKRAASALSALMALAAPRTKVIRDGIEGQVNSTDLVVGDIISLVSGDIVSGDCRVVSGSDIKVNEMLLTGESVDVHKSTVVATEGSDTLTPPNMIFSGTSVTSGNLKAVVVATGMNTRIGKIAALLQNADQRGKDSKDKKDKDPVRSGNQTLLQQALHRLGLRLGFASICICIIVFVVAIARGYDDPEHSSQATWLQSFLLAVTLAVAAIPEGLPLAVTVCLALGSVRMSKVNVLVRKLAAVEALGSANVICSDKTGTITTGKMTAVKLFAGKKHYKVTGQGFSPFGNIIDIATQANIVQDTLPHIAVESLLMLGTLCSNTKLIESTDKESNKQTWIISGNSSEAALVVAAEKIGLRQEHLNDFYPRLDELPFNSSRKLMITVHSLTKSAGTAVGSNQDVKNGIPAEQRLDSAPTGLPLKENENGKSEKEIEMMALNANEDDLEENNESAPAHYSYQVKAVLDDLLLPTFPDTKDIAIMKGAPNYIINHCSFMMNEKGVMQKFNEETRNELMRTVDDLSAEALRILAVALKPLKQIPYEANQTPPLATDHKFSLLAGPDKGYVFVGLFGIMDPPRSGVKEAIRAANGAGVKVCMITGDYLATATAISKKIGLLKLGDDTSLMAMDSSSLRPKGKYLPDDKLDALVHNCVVFARAQPEDKLYIINSFQRMGMRAAMTGDGVNDAPALKAADIGIAMNSGSAVAKQASQLVLLDDSFATIVKGLKEGRGIFQNVQKFINHLLGAMGALVLSMFITVIFGLPVIFSPLQILFINLVIFGFSALALCTDQAEEGLMQQKPKTLKEVRAILTPSRFAMTIIHIIVLTGVLLSLFLFGLIRYGTDRSLLLDDIYPDESFKDQAVYTVKRAQTMAFITMCFTETIHGYSVRFLDAHALRGMFANPTLFLCSVCCVGLTVLVVVCPGVQSIFSLVNLEYGMWLLAVAAAIAVMIIDEAVKNSYWSLEVRDKRWRNMREGLDHIRNELVAIRVQVDHIKAWESAQTILHKLEHHHPEVAPLLENSTRKSSNATAFHISSNPS